MAKVYFNQGQAYRLVNGKKKNVEGIEVPEITDCCKLDCCENVIFMTDKTTGAESVIYILNGVVTTTTKAQYEIDKAAGAFAF